MSDKELLFYNEYEHFYEMAQKSDAFRMFCKEAFGEDLSQDGFSDISQVNRILDLIPSGKGIHILDIGCGNGKMLGYLQKRTEAFIHGFDYSINAINTAKKLFKTNADFRQGLIGEIDYPTESFDVITSMDSMYFASDMEKFLLQALKWLKIDGVMYVCYQEGDVMPKTKNINTTVLARALIKNGISHECKDITKESYDLLKKKRETALLYKKDFEDEGNMEWFDLLMMQTDCVTASFDQFSKEMARYQYIIKAAGQIADRHL